MAEAIVVTILNKINNYLIDLGFISQTVSDKAVSKVKSSIQDSFLSSLKDYAKQGSTEANEKLEKIKKNHAKINDFPMLF